MDLTKLTPADKILAGSGIVFLLSTFLNWFSIKTPVGTFGGNGWEVGFLWGRLPFLIVLAMLVWIGLRYFSSVKLPPEMPQLYLAGGAAVALLVIVKLLIGEDNISRAFGLFVAAVSAAGFGYGSLLKFKEGGGDLDELKAQMKAKADELKKPN